VAATLLSQQGLAEEDTENTTKPTNHPHSNHGHYTFLSSLQVAATLLFEEGLAEEDVEDPDVAAERERMQSGHLVTLLTLLTTLTSLIYPNIMLRLTHNTRNQYDPHFKCRVVMRGVREACGSWAYVRSSYFPTNY
jgi:hypothetical protein